MLPQKLKTALAKFPDDEVQKISEAYLFAKEKHHGQKRKSGSPYILHPFRVALNLAKDGNDFQTIIAGLLHDTIEDTQTSKEEIKQNFGPEVAEIVAGVTSVSSIKIQDKARIFTEKDRYLTQVDNYKKLLFATAQNPKVMIVKLYDRLDNIETVKFLAKDKQKFYARETIEIFAPIAEKLGMGYLKGQLEDAAFPFAYPEDYSNFKKEIRSIYKNPESTIQNVIPEIKEILKNNSIEPLKIAGRAKFQYSLYKKIQRKGSIKNIFDIVALRIMVKDVPECYHALGVLHSYYEPLAGKIKDYIARPKSNGYQSLHTTVKDAAGNIFEVQIRTREMHEIAEFGIASHWHYKEKTSGNNLGQKNALNWINELEKLQDKDDQNFLSELKDEIFSEKIFVFTPKGEIIELPIDSTPIDFAYQIHSGLGNICIGAKINGRIMPIFTKLKTGDRVEIITNKNSKPKRDWLKFVRTSGARQKIKSFLRQENETSLVAEGLKKLNFALEKYELPLINKSSDLNKKLERSNLPYKEISKALVALAENTLSPTKLIREIFPGFKPEESARKKIVTTDLEEINSLRGIRHEFAKCCKPKVTDTLVGYLGREHIIKVHKKSCHHLKTADPRRVFEI